MSTIVSKEIYEMIQQAMDDRKPQELSVSFEYNGKRIDSRMQINRLSTTKEASQNLGPRSGFMVEINEVDIERIASLKSE